MSILIYASKYKNKINKSTFENISFAIEKLKNENDKIIIATNGNIDNHDIEALKKYGADQINIYKSLEEFELFSLSDFIEKIIKEQNIKTIIFSHDIYGKTIAPFLSGKLKMGIITNVIDYNNTNNLYKREVFSGKGYSYIKFNSPKGILTLAGNIMKPIEKPGLCEIKIYEANKIESSVKLISKEVSKSEEVLLPDAEIVVSGGRGLKGPENWGIIEELAKELKAATACSRPVADSHWRPHHEHVGQTGIAIRPNLYFAIGISGAIQHLAGVNGSKVKVVINNDKEAPFFSAAEYGIIGDAFEVVPKLIESIKKVK